MKIPKFRRIVFCVIIGLFCLNSGCDAMMSEPFPSLTSTRTVAIYQRTVAIKPKIIISTPTPTLTETPVLPTSTPTLTNPSQTPSPTWTPLPTLGTQDAKSKYLDLLKYNPECRLPCWWGITPGETTGETAKQFLESFNYVEVWEISDDLYRISAQIPLPEGYGTSRHDFIVSGNVVEYIYAYNHELAPDLYLKNFLKTYGPPEEVSIRTFSTREMGSEPFVVDLFYPDKGILMEYSGGRIETIGDYLHNCFEDMYSPFLYLWSPDRILPSNEAIEFFLDTENLPEPVPLYEAAGMDIETFYETLITDEVLCIVTPKEIWP